MGAAFAFVFVDLTTEKTPDTLRPAPSFQDMIEALLDQVANDYAPACGAPTVSIRAATADAPRLDGEIAINCRDTIDEAPGALAYHQVTNGVPDIEIGCDLFSSVVDGAESISSGVSHELLETLGDPGANEWADRQDGGGQTEAHEECDPVQNTFYTKTASSGRAVAVSNFVLPAYFIPGAAAPWDFLGVMQAQNDLSKGYAIRATAPTDAGQVQGRAKTAGKAIAGAEHLSTSAKRRKRHPYSRTYRRGGRL